MLTLDYLDKKKESVRYKLIEPLPNKWRDDLVSEKSC